MATSGSGIGPILVDLKNQILRIPFRASEWTELGALVDMMDYISGHRLLKALYFGDDDYEECVLKVLRRVAQENPDNVEIMSEYVASKDPESGEHISSGAAKGRRIVFAPQVFEIPEGDIEIDLVSVMMPFGAAFSPVHRAISDASESVGLRCQRADDIWEHSAVIQDVFSLIFRSFVVVCDFSTRNPNVFYEAGIAHTLGKHVIPIAQNEDDIPFDIGHHRYRKYLPNAEGLADLTAKLSKRLETLIHGRT